VITSLVIADQDSMRFKQNSDLHANMRTAAKQGDSLNNKPIRVADSEAGSSVNTEPKLIISWDPLKYYLKDQRQRVDKL